MSATSQTPTPDLQLFRDVFNASPIGIAVENLEGQPLFVNPAFCSMLGFSERELRSKHCVDFSPPEDAEKDWALFQKLRAGSIDRYQMEKRYFRRDRSLVWGSLSISLLNSHPSPLVLVMVEDITEKKKAERARFRHAAIIESSEDAIASVTLDGVIVSWNAGAQHIYGYTKAEAIGESVNILVPPELADEENKILETLRAGGRIEHFETLRVTKTGKRINVSLSISPTKDSNGAIVGLSGIARDISELKRHEQELRSSEGRLRLAQQAARIGSFERDVRTGRITWAEGLDSLYGLPPGSVDGKTPAFFKDLVHPADRERVAHLIQEALKTGQPTEGEWRAIWPDGRVHWIAGRWQVLMDDSGEPSRVAGVNMDVTERKLAEQALHAHEELLKIFVKNVPAAVAMLDRDMHYLQVSDRWCANYSVDGSQILGRSHYEIFPDIPERWKQAHRRALEGETLRAEEDRWDRESGTSWERWEIRPWQNLDGCPGGILIFSEDITRRKQMEEALSGVSGRLIEAQEKERARIARELHDDICQQLALVSIELEQFQRKLPDSVSEHRSHVRKLRKRIIAISTDVQTMSHELHSAKLSYFGIAVAIKSFCREFSEHHKIQIEFESRDLPSRLPPDVSLCLFRVLQEAIHNAVKHSGVKRVEVHLWGTSGDVHLTISDLGSGFDTEAAKKGRGLGITSMQERIKLVNGELTITAQPKHGTTIHARVPLDLESQSTLAAG